MRVSVYACMCAQSCPTLCDPMDCSPPGSSFHGIFQARVLEWAAISSSRGTSQPWYQTHFSCIAGRFFTTELPGKSFESQRGEQLIIVLIAHETNLPHSPSVRCLFSVLLCTPHTHTLAFSAEFCLNMDSCKFFSQVFPCDFASVMPAKPVRSLVF